MRHNRNHHLTLPPEQFYFASVEQSSRRRMRNEQVLYAAEPYLPVPLEDVHTSIVTANDGTTIFCAVPRDVLASLPAATLTLRPAALPDCFEGIAQPEQFNLLTGPYEPRRVRRLRRGSSLLASFSILLLSTLIVTGFTRRAAALRDAAAVREDAVHTVAQRVIESPPGAQSTQQLFLQLTAELRGLRQTRAADIVDPELFDAPAILAELLALWPSDLIVRTESLNIARSQITVRADVQASTDVQRLADALAQLPGWQLQQPRVNATRDGAVCTITLVPGETTP